jgi:hypothetical protein
MSNKEKTDTKIKQFRLRGKKLLLTYSQLNVNLLEDVRKLILDQLEKKVPKIIQYIIAEEKHQDGGIHYHIYLEFNTRAELYGANCLDLQFDGINYHGNYETVRKKDWAIRYIIKDKNFIAEPPLNVIDGELYLDFKEYLTKLYEKAGINEIKNYLISNPLLMSKGGSSVLKHLQEIDKLKFEKMIKQHEDNSIIPIENFNIPKELLEWFITGCVETLIINGLSGMGKTELIKSFLKSKGIEFLLIRNVHGLRDYNPQVHKAVIFDDIFFEKELSSEEHIGIADTANPSNIRILRDSIRLMQNTLRIFTTNNVKKLLFNNYDNKAVLSRYFILNINKSLFKDDIEIDVTIKIRNKNRENKVYEHNLKILKELGIDSNYYNIPVITE